MTILKIAISTSWHNEGLKLEEELINSKLKAACLPINNLNDLKSIYSDLDALIIDPTLKIDKKQIEKLTKCQVIVTQSIGYDHINLQAASEKDIIVANIPNYCLEEVSDHTLSLILSSIRQISNYNKKVKEGAWETISFPAPLQFKKTVLGIAGFGRLGQLLAKKANNLFKEILAYDPFMNFEKAKELNVSPINSLEELIPQVDVLTLHIPGSPNAQTIINKKTLSLFKPSAILINTARGNLINEEDLAESLKQNKLRLAALDVLKTEPPKKDNILIPLENTIITPHVAWSSSESSKNSRIKAVEEAIRALRGEKVLFKVN